MSTESGFSNQKKLGDAQFKTIHSLGSNRYGTSVSSKALSEISATPKAITNVLVDTDPKILYIEVMAHGARKHDVLRFMSGTLIGYEVDIIKVIDANTLQVLNVYTPTIGDTVKPMRWVTSKADSEGNVNFSPGPTQFVKNGSAVVVTQDTVPANNKGLPTQLMIMKDGVQYPVSKDTAVAANTLAVPVEIVGLDGTTINITAGDINVQLTDQGANADKTRIGDGTNTLGITATGEAKTHDADAITQLTAINAAQAGRATSALQTTGNTSLGSIDGKLTGVSTAANQVTGNNSLSSIDGKITGLATTVKQDALLARFPSSIGQKTSVDSLSVVLSSDSAMAVTNALGAKEAKQDTQITNQGLIKTAVDSVAAKLPSTIGQKAAADSLSVVFASGTTLSASISGGATEVKQDAEAVLIGGLTETAPTTDVASSGLNGRLQRIAQRLTSLIGLLPASLGAKTSAASLSVVLASDQAVLSSQAASVAGTVTSAKITVGTTAVRATVAGSAPSAARKKLMIKPALTNGGNIYLGASGVTTGTGLQIVGPDRLEFEFDSADYYLISDTAGQSVEILEKV